MTHFININSPVDVTAMGFGKNMRSYPRRMEFDGATYSFVDAGIRMVVRRGERIAHIFAMTDGTRSYRLRSDGGEWTLLGMTR